MPAITHHPARKRRYGSARLFPLATLIAGCCAPHALAQEAPPRGRDPWAFRLTLENKTRMLVVALRPDLWAAYNPANGTLHKVWSGGIHFRGKVYDFGQRNSIAQGTTYHLLEKAFLFSATDESVLPAGWTTEGTVTTGPTAWTLADGGARLVSPAVDLTRHDNVSVAYQTPGANHRLQVEVSTDDGATWDAQHWLSADGPGDDGHQKLLAVTGGQVRLRFRRNSTGGNTATLADVTLAGDYRAWSLDQGGARIDPTVDWRGYRLIGRTEGIAIRYDLRLPGGGTVEVEERPEALPGTKLSRLFSIRGLPAGTRLSLELDGSGYQASHHVTPGASLRTADGDTFLDFDTDGEATLETQWAP